MATPGTHGTVRAEDVREWVTNHITQALDIRRDDFSPDATFDSYGLDSAELVIMGGLMEEEFNLEIDPETFFQVPTVNGLVNTLVTSGVVHA